EEEILNERIYGVVPNFDLEKLLDSKEREPIPIKYDDEHYLVFPNFVDNKKIQSIRNKIIILYWVNNTDFVKLKQLYKDETAILSLVYIDNYDDVKNSTPDINRPILLAEIDKRITEYFSEYNGVVRKFENDKYLVIIDNKALEDIQEKRFDLLDNIRELDYGNKIPITLSIGVAATEGNLLESHNNARAAIDIALGRGGDQAVLNRNGTLDFYGGKSKALEKRNKVRSRVIGYALRQLIDQADNVFVMGHKNPDMDSFGSALGVLRGVQNRKKDGYIVLGKETTSIKNIMARLEQEQPELLDKIITAEEAEELIKENSLMVLVDNHKPSFTEAPELLDLIDSVVIIDHHRRGAEFVKDPVLIYLEPYASSTSELVTEILSYMSDNTNLTKFEAEALLAGITVDTKNFSFQTGVRTFEAASILKRAGADTTAVRQLFREDHDTFIYKASVIKSSKVIRDTIVVGRLEEELDNGVLIAAQAANELLDINGIEVSFVLTYANDRVHISGRSLGNISVQLILENLGGGGHLTSAGVQLTGINLDDAEIKLMEAIDKYFGEGES
ncbi:MAG TPA: DHH family phosphoesterase, partial [Tissierellaceae bacterium]|nr:DHH family phosphoesterase [Tissierellaceae bacterium]